MLTDTWQRLLIALLVLAVAIWSLPGLRAAMARSRGTQKDWGAVLWPLGLVILFVIGLIVLSRKP